MRTLLAIGIAVALLGLPSVLAQENTITYSTSVDPETYTFQSGKFQEDANGDRIKDENGSFVPLEQFVTLHLEASMPCAVPPSGERIQFTAAGGFWKITENGEERHQLDLRPRVVIVNWTQGPAGEWVVKQDIQIQVVSESKPAKTIQQEFNWNGDASDIPTACPQDSQAPTITPHTIIIPGSDFNAETGGEPTGTDGEGVETPAPGLVGLIGAVGLAVALRRRQ